MRNRIYRNLIAVTAAESFLVGLAMLADRNFSWSGELTTSSKLLANSIGILGALIVTVLLVGIAFWLDRKPEDGYDIDQWITRSGRSYWLMGFAFLIIVESVQDVIYLFTSGHKPHVLFIYYSSYLMMFLPYFIWGILVGLTFIWIALKIDRKDRDHPRRLSNNSRTVLIIFCFLAVFWLLVGFTDFGYISLTYRYEFRKEFGRFLPLTNPIMGNQVLSVVIILILISLLVSWLKKKKIPGMAIVQNHYLIAALIWLVAFLLWSQVPIEPNYLVDFPTVPKGVIYPNSDAFYFAKESQRLTAGAGFEVNSTHVMYSTFIALLRTIVGESYQKIVTLQIAIVSFVPVLLYLFGKKIYNQFAGLLAGSLFIIREWNAMLLGAELAGTNSNELMSENLGLIGIIVFLYLIYSWVENPRKKRWNPWIAGGVMGISLLIRADFAAALLAVSFVSLIWLWDRKKDWLLGISGLFLVIALILTPWINRNWQMTGDIFLDKQNVMQERIKGYMDQIFTPGDDGAINDNTGDDASIIDNPDDGTTAAKDPDEGTNSTITRNIPTLANHFGNSLHQAFLYLPNIYQPGFDFSAPVYESLLWQKDLQARSLRQLTERSLNVHIRSVSYYWFEWDGRESVRSILPVAVSLFLIALGISSSQKDKIHFNLLLVSALLAHCFIWAVPGFSGNRFIKTLDWIVLLFYSIGLIKIIRYCFGKCLGDHIKGYSEPWFSEQDPEKMGSGGHKSPVLMAIVIVTLVLIGSSPSILEGMIPSQYSKEYLTSILKSPDFDKSVTENAWNRCLDEVDKNPEIELFFGSAIYPRYYQQGEIRGNDRRLIPQDIDVSRIGFYLVGDINQGVLLEGAEKDQIFAHSTDVIVIGKVIRDQYIFGSCVFKVEDEQDGVLISTLYDSGAMLK